MKLAVLAAYEFYCARYRKFANRESFLQWQSSKLQAHLAWVSQNSPYYRDLTDHPLADYPLMDKQLMMDNFTRLNTLGFDRDELFDVALAAESSRDFQKSELQGVTVGLSSGTTGRRGLFLATKEERARWAGYITGRLMPSIVKPQKIALLLRANSALYKTVAKAHIQFHYVDLCQPVEDWLSELEAFAPTIMIGSAQALVLSGANSKKLNPQMIVSGAEVLSIADKQFLNDRFSCEVKEIYQCTEGLLACTHSDGQLRWNEDLIHVEPKWLDQNKTHYQPVVTDFRRRSQPIIRYLMDDVIVAGSDPHGVFKSIASIAGRSGDILRFGSVRVLPDLIYNAVSRAVPLQVDYQISQLGDDRLRIATDHSYDQIKTALCVLLSSLGLPEKLFPSFEASKAPDWQLSEKRRRVVNLGSS